MREKRVKRSNSWIRWKNSADSWFRGKFKNWLIVFYAILSNVEMQCSPIYTDCPSMRYPGCVFLANKLQKVPQIRLGNLLKCIRKFRTSKVLCSNICHSSLHKCPWLQKQIRTVWSKLSKMPNRDQRILIREMLLLSSPKNLTWQELVLRVTAQRNFLWSNHWLLWNRS